jgi:hypothetical protein
MEGVEAFEYRDRHEEAAPGVAEKAFDLALIWHDRADAPMSLPHFSAGVMVRPFGMWGVGSTQVRADRAKDMGCEPEPLNGRPCGLPECAASADP